MEQNHRSGPRAREPNLQLRVREETLRGTRWGTQSLARVSPRARNFTCWPSPIRLMCRVAASVTDCRHTTTRPIMSRNKPNRSGGPLAPWQRPPEG